LRRHPRKDRVSSELWDRIVLRDAHRIWRQSENILTFPAWMSLTKVICVVGFLGPSGSVSCFGGQTLEHVKDDLMMGRRAPSDERHLVAACWGHNAYAPPSKEIRHQLRAWLKAA
jgi:hypothetical protein